MNSVYLSVGNYCTCELMYTFALLNLIFLHISASYSFPLVMVKDTYLEVNLVSLILNQRCNITSFACRNNESEVHPVYT